MTKKKVMIVDDQSISRNLLELYIEASNNYEVAFSISSTSVVDVYLLKNKVDLILMDILMNNGPNGLDTAEKIKKQYPDIKIIAITSMPEFSWLARARSIGVDSFWYKESDETTILNVMDRTVNGESVYPDNTPHVKLGLADSSEFTERELEVLQIITSGASNSKVAELLNISEHTVKTHVRNMLSKTGYASRTELAINARVTGLAINTKDSDEKQ